MWEQAKHLLLALLEFMHGTLNNIGMTDKFSWGIAIILLTLLVRALMYPLTRKQMTSMQKMQKLQPIKID